MGTSSSEPHVAARVASAVLASYVLCWGLVAMGITGLVAAGMDFEDAEHLCLIVAVLAYVALFMWGFVVRRWAAWGLAAACAGVLMAGLAQWLQAGLVD